MIKLFKTFLKDYKLQLIIGPLCKLLEAVFELIVPLVMAKIIDTGVKNGDTDYIIRMGIVMVLLGVVGLCSALVCQYSASIASQGAGTKMRSALFAHINSLSHAELDKFGTPSLITRMTNDINQVQQAVAMLIRLVIRAPFLVIGAMVMAMLIDFKLSIIFIGAAVLIGVTLYLIMSRSIPFFTKIQKQLDKISLISRENLTGNRVIRAFSKQKSEQSRFDESTQQLAKTSVTVGRLSVLLNPLTYVIANLAIVLIVWFGAKGVNTGKLLTGDIIALVNYMTQILLAMVVVANLVVLFTKASASAERINEVLDTVPTVQEKTDKNIEIKADNSTPIIEFKNVSFSYGGGDDELENLSFKIMSGQTVGIIGTTGSGKSTLINLIPRFYKTKSGEVLVDGVNVSDYSFSQLRSQIGIVPQNAVLFSGDVRSNLRWGNETATDEQMWKALEIAQAADFLKQKNGLDTKVSQGGKNFSGGQRQRLTIARAVVRQPRILILDDSFSALDYATDAKLRNAIKQNSGDMTVIIVSQRCSTIMDSDLILFLDDGRLSGAGTHDKLLQTCPQYAEICKTQLGTVEEK